MEQPKPELSQELSPQAREAITRQRLAAVELHRQDAYADFLATERASSGEELADDRFRQIDDIDQRAFLAQHAAQEAFQPSRESRVYKVRQWFRSHLVR